jgi:digeranylgeranylglycerophospholipid reductase
MIENEYDVVIAGVGPAGSAAAIAAAKKGASVLAVEKRQEIGSPKRCGEGLSKSSLERMDLDFDQKWACQTIWGVSVYAPNGKFVRIDYKGPEGWIIERKIFDKELAKQASRAGAKVIAKTEVVDAERKNKMVHVKIKTPDGIVNVRTRVLVAADGVESQIPRMMGMDTTLKLVDVASAAQLEMSNIDIDSKRIELYFGNQIAPGGYVWIFPKGKDSANVGIGVRKPFSKMTAYEYLKKFVENRKDLRSGSIIEFNTGGVPVGGLMKNMVMDNFMTIGDAARQVNPIHGGGIAEAYVGGRIAGEIIGKALEKENYSAKVLSEYNKIWWDLRGKKLEKVLKLRHVVESLTDDDLNWLVDYLKGEDLVSLSQASGMEKLAYLMMKKPKLLMLAKKLL